MAYQAEIQIGVKGIRDLRNAQAKIERLSRQVNEVNKKPLFNTAVVANLNTYNTVLAKANRTLAKTQIELDSAGNAVNDYKKAITNVVKAQADANEAKSITNNLLAQEARNLGLATEKLQAYNAAAAPARQVGSMAGAYLRPGEARLQGQTSAINPQAQIKAAKEEQIRQEQQLLAANDESIKRLRLRARIEQKIADVRSARIAREESASFLGSSGTQPQGPFAGAGALGFPVALPLLKGERKALDTANKITEILERRKRLQKELGGSAEKLAAVTRKGITDEERVNGQIRQRFGLRGALQALENKSLTAIKDANRQEDELTQEKTKQLELEKLINKERLKQSISRRRRIVNTAKETRRRRKEAIGSGIIGGAFPLLFGQGAGASVGGAVGGVAGGLVGGQFGFGLSLVGTQLGTIFDSLVTKAGDLANSLNTTGEILSGLEKAGFKVSDATKGVIASYEEAGLLSDAYALALGEVNRVLGPDGVEKLDAYKTETKRLNAEFEKISGALQSELIPALTGLLRIILGAKAAFDTFADSPLGQLFLKGAKELVFNAPGGGGLRGASFAIGALQAVGAPTGPAEKPEAQRLAEEKLAMDTLDAEQKRNKAAREQRYLLDAQIDLAKLGNNLLDEAVVKAKKKVIQETYLADMRKKDLTDQEKLLANDKRKLALTQLNKSIKDAEAAAAAKTSKEAKSILRLNRAIGSEKLKQDKLERSIQLVGKDKLTKLRTELESLNDREILERAFIISSTEDVKLQDEKLKTLALQFDLKEAQLKQTEKDLILQQKLNDITREQKLGGLQRELRQEVAGGGLPTGDPFRDPFIDLERQQQFRREDIFSSLSDQEEKLRAQLTGIAPQDTNTLADIKNIEDQRAAYESLLPSIEQNQRAQLLYNQTLSQVQGPVNALVGGLQDVVAGTKTAQEAFSDFLKTIADQLIKTAATMIAQYIAIGIAKAFAFGGGGGGSSVPSSAYGDMSIAGPSFFQGGMIPGFAEGGYVSGPTRALIGEGGESEYVIPESKMRESMARYSRGARGSSVIPSQAGGGDSEMSGGTAVAAPIDVRYTVERINSVDYVTADQFQLGMQRAAQQGATEGERRTLRSLKNSPGTRRGVGM